MGTTFQHRPSKIVVYLLGSTWTSLLVLHNLVPLLTTSSLTLFQTRNKFINILQKVIFKFSVPTHLSIMTLHHFY